jgi:prevent-host-death family protein
MDIISSVEFQRHLGQYQDRALVEPVLVTRNGRERLVLLSADEYRRLKDLDRQAMSVAALPEDVLQAIAAAEVPAEYAHLNHLLTR